jgi:Lysylphosphatidylglycerol synthase TM region
MPRQLSILLRVVGLLLLLGILLQRIDLVTVQQSWEGMGAGGILLCVACFGSAMAVRASKWNLQMRALGFTWDPLQQAQNFLLGVLIGAVTPMRVGELYRLSALHIAPELRAERLTVATASLLLEKGYEVLVLGSLVAVGALLLGFPWVGILALLALLFGAWAGLGSWRPPQWMVPRALRSLADRGLKARDGLPFSTRVSVLLLTMGAQSLNMVAGHQIYQSFGDVPFTRFFFGMPLLTFSSAVPVTIGGIGLRELAAMEVFRDAGIAPAAAAAAASLVFVGANLLPGLALLPIAAARIFRDRHRGAR